MTPHESEIVDMLDGGAPVRRVARETGLSISYVRWLATNLGAGSLERQQLRRDDAIRASTMALERAILATGRRHT